MLPPNVLNLPLQRANLELRLLDGGAPVALAGPALDVVDHLVHAPLLLVHRLAVLALVGLEVRVVDELEPARLPRAVLLVALLAEVAPAPVAAAPELVVEVAHFEWLCFLLLLLPLSLFSFRLFFFFLACFFSFCGTRASASFVVVTALRSENQCCGKLLVTSLACSGVVDVEAAGLRGARGWLPSPSSVFLFSSIFFFFFSFSPHPFVLPA